MLFLLYVVAAANDTDTDTDTDTAATTNAASIVSTLRSDIFRVIPTHCRCYFFIAFRVF